MKSSLRALKDQSKIDRKWCVSTLVTKYFLFLILKYNNIIITYFYSALWFVSTSINIL